VSNRRLAILCVSCGLLLAGCPKGDTEFSQGRKAEALQDYDTALDHYLKALKQDPFNAEYKMKAARMRFEASQFHVNQGQKLREGGQLQLALAEFQKAMAADPSSPIAEQEARQTLEMIAAQRKETEAAPASPAAAPEVPLAEGPPELKPISQGPINLKMANQDAKIIYETVCKIAGLTVIFDPDFPTRRISVDLNNVTLEQALDIVSLESKAFWKPVTENIIIVVPDQAQKRRDYEEQVVRTFYLSNTVQPQDLTEIVTGLRQLLDLKRLQQLNAQNAIIIRDTPDKIALAEKIIDDVDKARPEVVIQVEVLEVSTTRARDLGILPGPVSSGSPSLATMVFNPSGCTNSTSGSATSTCSTSQTVQLNALRKLGTGDWAITMPGAVLNTLLTDTGTKIIQNPEIRSVDGQSAKLRIGDRVPVATGSFQAGVGVGAVGAAGIVNPLVNTQFQYIDVGVNVDITPRVHPDHQISMKVAVEVSSVTGNSNIGGISQPVIGQRKIEHDIRLKEGEASILGGLIQTTDTKNLTGMPGLAKLPFFRYFFSDNNVSTQEQEILIVLTPHIVRLPEWTQANLRPLSSGTETNVQVRRASDIEVPKPAPAGAQPAPQTRPAGPPTAVPGGAPVTGAPAAPGSAVAPTGAAETPAPARIRFEPSNIALKLGQATTVSVVVENVTDLFSIPLLFQYNPAVISVDDVTQGGFLSGGTQEIAIVQRVDKEHGQAVISATRQPNTAGVSGNGTLLGLVVRALAPGDSNLSVVQANARDSQQKPIPLVSGEAAFHVQP
jgi:general secretion pathway protein D